MDECSRPGACGSGALCSNIVGGHQCSCSPGHQGDPYSSVGCVVNITLMYYLVVPVELYEAYICCGTAFEFCDMIILLFITFSSHFMNGQGDSI